MMCFHGICSADFRDSSAHKERSPLRRSRKRLRRPFKKDVDLSRCGIQQDLQLVAYKCALGPFVDSAPLSYTCAQHRVCFSASGAASHVQYWPDLKHARRLAQQDDDMAERTPPDSPHVRSGVSSFSHISSPASYQFSRAGDASDEEGSSWSSDEVFAPLLLAATGLLSHEYQPEDVQVCER